MMTPDLILTLFHGSYVNIKEATAALTHEQAVMLPLSADESVHWIVGHVVVARCNFLTLLSVPSLWAWATSKLFIPGSRPTAESAAHLPFHQLLSDLDQTQTQLTSALKQTTSTNLATIVEDKPLGHILLEYAVHESFHAGQLTVLQKVDR